MCSLASNQSLFVLILLLAAYLRSAPYAGALYSHFCIPRPRFKVKSRFVFIGF